MFFVNIVLASFCFGFNILATPGHVSPELKGSREENAIKEKDESSEEDNNNIVSESGLLEHLWNYFFAAADADANNEAEGFIAVKLEQEAIQNVIEPKIINTNNYNDPKVSYKEAKTILIKGEDLTEFPRSIMCANNATIICLYHNQINEIPLDFYAMGENLNKLDLHGNKITKIPSYLFWMKKLSFLDLSYNPLEKIVEDKNYLATWQTSKESAKELREKFFSSQRPSLVEERIVKITASAMEKKDLVALLRWLFYTPWKVELENRIYLPEELLGLSFAIIKEGTKIKSSKENLCSWHGHNL